MTKNELMLWISQYSQKLNELTDQIWGHPELKYEEFFASRLLRDFLQEEGFLITNAPDGIETAFIASFGSGSPVIGLLGEYDALSGLSQTSGALTMQPDMSMADGHGCGHNLLGGASALAACAIRKYLVENKLPGKIIFYGCPAEEGGSGKAFLARAGVFDCLDAALSWHPSDYNAVTSGSSLANMQLLYEFTGVSSHAASAPYLGRSALDAVELMDIGANYLREHMIPEARIHYAITDTGGKMPGIVQAHASVLYMIRAPKLTDVTELAGRLSDIAAGAALMTGTSVQIHFIKSTSNLIPNHSLEKLLYQNMQLFPAPRADEKDLAYAAELSKTLDGSFVSLSELFPRAKNTQDTTYLKTHANELIHDSLLPYLPFDTAQSYSTDVGDVSWICPTAQIAATTWIANSMEHTWQVTTQGKTPLAHKGALYASQILAASAVDLFTKPEILTAAKAEHIAALNGKTYTSPLPRDADYRYQLQI